MSKKNNSELTTRVAVSPKTNRRLRIYKEVKGHKSSDETINYLLDKEGGNYEKGNKNSESKNTS